MVMKYERNKYNVLKWVIYYNVSDIAGILNYKIKNTDNWKRWKIEYIQYDEIINKKKDTNNKVPQFEVPYEIDENVRIINPLKIKTDHNARYMHQKYLSTVLINTTSKESEIYKYWILEMPEIVDCMLRIYMEIKNEYEKEQQRYEIEKYKQQMKQSIFRICMQILKMDY